MTGRGRGWQDGLLEDDDFLEQADEDENDLACDGEVAYQSGKMH